MKVDDHPHSPFNSIARRPLVNAVAAISALVVLGLLFAPSLIAAPVRVSFLAEKAALRDTIEVLRTSGCGREATSTFEEAVRRYNSSGFHFDFSRFPKSHDAFYVFDSASALVAALPDQLCNTQHAYEFNCFDTISSVAGEAMRTSVRPDDLSGPYLVPHTPTNGSFTILPRATARDAFTLVYPSWYRDVTEEALPKSMRDTRISLTAALFQCYVLPQSTTREELAHNVMAALKADWKRHGMNFPPRFEIVLCHEVSLPQRWFVTNHAGILFPRERGYTYIEKSGGTGPFVRLDFDDRAALITWLGGMFRGAEKLGYTHHFASFNDTKIEELEFLKK